MSKIKLIERSNVCDRCKKKPEKLYMLPYLPDRFIDKNICRECSMLFHQEIYKFAKNFMENGTCQIR